MRPRWAAPRSAHAHVVLPVRSFQNLLGDLATLTRTRVRPTGAAPMTPEMVARPTPLLTGASWSSAHAPYPVA
ncbi:MAG: hypothetical protein J4F34_01120, partial [Gemmatimonadetes bacterium]|nr:hypothetical protein [Gemmatimonadota bacterium]